MQTIIAFVICCSAVSGSANVYFSNSCPKDQHVEFFDIERMLGTWYQLARYDNDIEEHEQCSSIHFRRENNGYTFKGSRIRDNKLLISEGTFTSSTNGSGIIYFRSSVFQDLDKSDVLPTLILDVDYDKYVAFYDCHYDATSKTHHDFFWIITKLQTYDIAMKNKIDSFLKSATFIDNSKLIWASQFRDCENVETNKK